MIRQPRNLSGIFFRFRNPETSKWENWCFEDLPEEIQKKYLENRSNEWIQSLNCNLMEVLEKIIKILVPGDIFNEDLSRLKNLNSTETDLNILKAAAISCAKGLKTLGDYFDLTVKNEEDNDESQITN